MSLLLYGPQFDALETFYLSTINSEVFPIAIYKEFTRNSNPLQMETKLARLSISLDQNMVLRSPIPVLILYCKLADEVALLIMRS
jgi:hypothetical protein